MRRLLEANGDHLVRDRTAVELDGVAGALADEHLAELGVVGDPVLEDVGLVGPDDVERLPLAVVVLELQARAQGGDRVFLVALDDHRAVHELLGVSDTSLVGALQQPGLVVGCALAQVTVREGGAHVVGQLLALLLLEVAQLFLDLLETLGGHLDGFFGHVTLPRHPLGAEAPSVRCREGMIHAANRWLGRRLRGGPVSSPGPPGSLPVGVPPRRPTCTPPRHRDAPRLATETHPPRPFSLPLMRHEVIVRPTSGKSGASSTRVGRLACCSTATRSGSSSSRSSACSSCSGAERGRSCCSSPATSSTASGTGGSSGSSSSRRSPTTSLPAGSSRPNRRAGSGCSSRRRSSSTSA